jgi:long-chain acyl-CoA synthetase
MSIDFFLERFENNKDQPAIIWQEKIVSYGELLGRYNDAISFLKSNNIVKGEIVSVTGDFSPNAIVVLLALINNKNIIVPFNAPIKESESIKFEIAQVEKSIIVDLITDTLSFETRNTTADHEYFKLLREREAPGLVLFTSGTSGFPKGAVHDFSKLLNKFKTARSTFRTINFLLFDHWGGLNTLFHTLSNCGVVLALRNRKPDAVCEFIEQYKIELLPVSPSFLNLLILSETYKKFDLSSLKLITYGTEPMPQQTLKRAIEIFPNISFQQTYGLIELGVLRAKSKSADSLWVKIGGEGYDLRVVNNILQIKADSAMLGYLNAVSPFTDDGYFITGDEVEVDGEYYKILGRKSEIINVGGDKVYPQEVENIILGLDNVLEVTVYGEKHALMGNIVCARIVLKEEEDKKEFTKRLKSYCKERMQGFKIPVKIFIEEAPLYNERFKKTRNKF